MILLLPFLGNSTISVSNVARYVFRNNLVFYIESYSSDSEYNYYFMYHVSLTIKNYTVLVIIGSYFLPAYLFSLRRVFYINQYLIFGLLGFR